MTSVIPGTVWRIYLDTANAWRQRCVLVDTDATGVLICVPLGDEQPTWAVGDAVSLQGDERGRWHIIV